MHHGHDLSVLRVKTAGRQAALSLDLEYDYAGDQSHSLSRFSQYLDVCEALQVPTTIFCETRVLRQEPALVEQLKRPMVTACLHCNDHRKPGDTPEELERGFDYFSAIMGFPPSGYRAHTFQFSPALIAKQLELGMTFDASMLPARFGYGANHQSRLWLGELDRNNAAAMLFRFNGENPSASHPLVGLPVGVLPVLGVPFIQSYQLLAGRWMSAILQRIFGLPGLFVHDAHMVDMVRSLESLNDGVIPETTKKLYRLSWIAKGNDSFAILKAFVSRSRQSGHEFFSLDEIAKNILAKHRAVPLETENVGQISILPNQGFGSC